MILHFVARGAGHREGKIGWHEEQITSVGCRGKKISDFSLRCILFGEYLTVPNICDGTPFELNPLNYIQD